MTRRAVVAAAFTIGLAITTVLAVVDRGDRHQLGTGENFHVAATDTTWIETLPTLPAGFDPANLTTTSMKRKARRAAGGSVWDRLAECECRGNWACNTGNGYFGGLQMEMAFWRSYGGIEYAERPDLATRDQQIIVAERARVGRGLTPWPHCSRRLGLR